MPGIGVSLATLKPKRS